MYIYKAGLCMNAFVQDGQTYVGSNRLHDTDAVTVNLLRDQGNMSVVAGDCFFRL